MKIVENTTLPPLSRSAIQPAAHYPERIVQFGGGNFLRAFIDWMVEILNDEAGFASNIVIVKPTPQGDYAVLENQEGLFHVHLNGIHNGELVNDLKRITCVSRVVNPYQDFEAFLRLARQPEVQFIISNTTEAGIKFNAQDRIEDTPPDSFPAKLAIFLYERYTHFDGATDKGCIVLPCELIEDNGLQLQQILLQYAEHWSLEAGFCEWLQAHNRFCNTLVDRIVAGFPQSHAEALMQQIGFRDDLLVEGEHYHSWVIEDVGGIQNELPTRHTTLNVKFVEDLKRYRKIKVRILNGAHTAMMPLGYLLGLETVKQVMENKPLEQFIEALLLKEVVPVLDGTSLEVNDYALAILDRFRNPHLHHQLINIALNSLEKFNVRLLPTLVEYTTQTGQLPKRIVLAFAALIRFYKGEWQGKAIPLNDNPVAIEWLKRLWQQHTIPELVEEVLANETLWGQDLHQIAGLSTQLNDYLNQLESNELTTILVSESW